MKRPAFVAGTLGLALASPFASHPSAAADWQFVPSSNLATGYVDNPRFLEAGGREERQGTFEVAASLSRVGERTRIGLAPRATFQRYEGDRALDADNQDLALSASWQGERTQWSMSAQGARDTTQSSEIGTTGLVQGNQRRENVTAGIASLWTVSERLSGGLQAQWSDVHYVEGATSGLVDYARTSASANGAYAVSGRTRVTLAAQAGEFESALSRQPTRDAGVTLGVSHSLGALWSLSAAAGPSWADAGPATARGTLYSASLIRQGEQLRLTGSASRRLEPVGSGFLSQLDTVSIGLSRPLGEHVSLSVAGGRNRSLELLRVAGSPGREVAYSSVQGSVGWNFAPSWTVSLTAEVRRQQVELTGASPESADGYRAWLAFGWAGRARSL